MAGLSNQHIKILEEKYAIAYLEPLVKDLEQRNLLISLTFDEVNQRLKRDDITSGGIYIGYPNAPDNFTIRLDEPLINEKGKKQKYLKPKGQENHLYIPANINIKEIEELWITEGELKALSGSLRGLPVVALSGIWNWRGNKANQLGGINDLFEFSNNKICDDNEALILDLNIDWSGKKVVLLYDSDITNKHSAWDAFPRLAEQLYRLNAREVKIITCPKPKRLWGDKKAGLDDLFVVAKISDGELTEDTVIKSLTSYINNTPIWIPLEDGSEQFANNILAMSNPEDEQKLNGAIACLGANDEIGLRDYLQKLGRGHGYVEKIAKKQLNKVLKRQSKALPEKVPLEELKENIQLIQKHCKTCGTHKEIEKDQVYLLVLNSLKMAGRFFKSFDNNVEVWYFSEESKLMMEISSVEFETYFTELTGISIKNEYGRSIVTKIFSYACQEAQSHEIYITSHHDKKSRLLYLDLYNGEMLKLDGNEIERVPIGTDDVYFTQDSQWQPWEYIKVSEEDEEEFIKIFFGYVYAEESKLKPPHAKIVDLTWKIAAFFRDMLPTRGILLYTGEKGSGKSNKSRIFLRTMYGNRIDVSVPLQSNQEQLTTLITNRSLVCLDNLDNKADWLLDILATAATGGKIPKRVLYVTNKIAEYTIKAWIMITSRTPKLHRDDIAERLITIHLSKLKKYTKEEELLTKVSNKRNAFLSIFADLLNGVIRYSKENEPQDRQEDFRLADFAAFMRLFLCSALGEQEGNRTTDKILDELKESQAQFYIEEDTLILLIKTMMEKKRLKEKKAYKSSELLDLINGEAKRREIKFSINSVRVLNSIIKERIAAAAQIHQILITQGNSKGYTTFKFSFLKEK